MNCPELMKKAAKKPHFIIGIDEVGRGPLAGPVTVAAVAFPSNSRLRFRNRNIPLRDSKKLSLRQRAEWLSFIKKNKILFSISDISPKIIDKINISNAANLAASRCVEKIMPKLSGRRIHKISIFLDGGLYIKSKNLKHLSAKTVIKGDEKIPAISLASIVAKIHRDELMAKLHKKHPAYNFDKHKGYGTKLHYKAIKKNGISEIHRKSFLKNLRSK